MVYKNIAKKRGITIEAFGKGWDNGTLSAKEMNELFCKFKDKL
ncbi:MAG: hypothetical protein Q9M40_12110 [Sulfurimonas sp.]|nr:hypothetical protein [Sulfurimonas sp.]